MGRYIRKRLLQAVPVVFGITILTFFIMKMTIRRSADGDDKSPYLQRIAAESQRSTPG